MRFALLGTDDATLELATAAVESKRHELISIYGNTPQLRQLMNLAPAALIGDSWESLLATKDLDAVFVASSGDQEQLDDQLRKLIAAGIPLIASHPVCEPLVAFELEMIHQDVGAPLIPYFPNFHHPAVDRLRKIVEQASESPIGVTEQLVFDRYLDQRDRQSVCRQFVRDAESILSVIGECKSISAIPGSPDDPYPHLAVSITGESGLAARWSVGPSHGEGESQIHLIGTAGRATVSNRTNGTAILEVQGSESVREEFPASRGANEALAALESGSPDSSAWLDACHHLDLLSTLEQSLRRKRTIELRNVDHPEESAFKGIMAAGGCLLLVAALLFTVAFAVVEGFRMPMAENSAALTDGDAAPRTHILIRMWPVYPMLAFLLLQALLWVAKRPNARSDENASAASSGE